MRTMAKKSRKPDTRSGWIVRSALLRLRTHDRLELVDLTDRIADVVRRSGVVHGIVSVQTRHTTTAVLVNENEPLLIRDLLELFERWAPREGSYRHDDLAARGPGLPADERRNGDAHARAALLRASETLNVVDGVMQLGRWQRVFLVELDGERDRTLSVLVLGSGSRE